MRFIQSSLFASAAAIVVATAIAPAPAQAFEVDPMVYSLAAQGSASSRTVRVSNTHPGQLTLEVQIFEMRPGADGAIDETKAADADFAVFPPQAIMARGAKQAFRIQYVGGAADTSKSYRVRFRQVPVDLDRGAENAFQMVFDVGTIAHVVAPTQSPSVTTTAVSPQGTVSLTNTGTRFADIGEYAWFVVEPGGARREIASIDVQKENGFRFVLPGQSRTFALPKSVNAPAGAKVDLVKRER